MLFWLAETISILHPALKISLFCIDHSMYWLNRIKLMILHFDIRFNDKIAQEKIESWLDTLFVVVTITRYGTERLVPWNAYSTERLKNKLRQLSTLDLVF